LLEAAVAVVWRVVVIIAIVIFASVRVEGAPAVVIFRIIMRPAVLIAARARRLVEFVEDIHQQKFTKHGILQQRLHT